MKYTVLGFSQQRLMELGLGMDEAMILRWFIDYQATGKMRKMTIDGVGWVWVNYAGVLGDIPIVGGSAKTISRRFEKLEASGVMEHTTLREGGTFSCYRINEAVYATLIDDAWIREEPADEDLDSELEYGGKGRTELSEGGTLLGEGVGQICTRGSDKSVRPKDSSTRKTLLQDKKHIPPLPPEGQRGVPELQSQQYRFDQFWSLYPKRRAKGDAEKAWRKLAPSRELFETILAAIATQSQSPDWQKDGGQFIPYPATWLRRKGWEDVVVLDPQRSSEQLFRAGRFNDAWAGKTTREVEL